MVKQLFQGFSNPLFSPRAAFISPFYTHTSKVNTLRPWNVYSRGNLRQRGSADDTMLDNFGSLDLLPTYFWPIVTKTALIVNDKTYVLIDDIEKYCC